VAVAVDWGPSLLSMAWAAVSFSGNYDITAATGKWGMSVFSKTGSSQ